MPTMAGPGKTISTARRSSRRPTAPGRSCPRFAAEALRFVLENPCAVLTPAGFTGGHEISPCNVVRARCLRGRVREQLESNIHLVGPAARGGRARVRQRPEGRRVPEEAGRDRAEPGRAATRRRQRWGAARESPAERRQQRPLPEAPG